MLGSGTRDQTTVDFHVLFTSTAPIRAHGPRCWKLASEAQNNRIQDPGSGKRYPSTSRIQDPGFGNVGAVETPHGDREPGIQDLGWAAPSPRFDMASSGSVIVVVPPTQLTQRTQHLGLGMNMLGTRNQEPRMQDPASTNRPSRHSIARPTNSQLSPNPGPVHLIRSHRPRSIQPSSTYSH